MRPGHDKTQRLARCACFCVWLVAASAHAAPLRVLLCDPHDPELLERVRGQARDLALTLQVIEPPPTRDAATLAQDARARSASALVCIDALSSSGHAVFVFDALAGATHTRQVPAAPDHGALATSAMRETVAIVVRSELAQLMAAAESRASETAGAARAPAVTGAPGGAHSAASPSGAARANSQADAPVAPPPVARAGAIPAAAATPVPETLAPAADRPASTSSSAVSAVVAPPAVARVRVAVGWELGAIGADTAAHAALARAAVDLGMFELGFGGAFGLASDFGVSQLSARVQRHALRASLLAGWPRAAKWRVFVGAHAGLCVFTRSTRLRAPRLVATSDAATIAGAFGPDLLLRVDLTARIGLALGLVGDVVPAAPRYAVERSGARQTSARASTLEPAANLSMFLAL